MSSTLNILAVEDNEDDMFLLREAFKKSGFSHGPIAVSNGIEAVAYLKGDGVFGNREEFPTPNVMLLDLNMPRMNGFEVLRWVRNDPQWHRLIVHVLTASSREADVRQAYDSGANSFITKPSRFTDLVAFVGALQQWHRFTSFSRQPDTDGILAGVNPFQH